MKKKLTAALLIGMLVFAFFPKLESNAEEPVAVKIGLYYGSNALPASNLQYATGYGSGYRFGYFSQENANNFTSLMEVTGQAEITVLKDKLIYGSNKTYYDVAPSSYSFVIAPYHLQLSSSFVSAADALAKCEDLKLHNLSAFPAYINGQFRVRVGSYSSQSEANKEINDIAVAAADSLTVVGYSSTCYTVAVTGQATILFEFDQGGDPFGIQTIPSGSAKTQTWTKGYKYYGGFEYNRVNGNDITVINVVELNDYLKGVIPYEMSPSWPVEALKAQTLCAKSYCINNLHKHRSQGFDLCNTTDCQVYYGTGNATAASDGAVEAVRGQYVTYGGKIAQTYYHASSGGWTENSENIWGAYVPYLRAVEDKYLTNPINWSFSLNNAQIAEILRSKGYTVSSVTNYYVSELTEVGNVRGVTIERSGASPLVFTGEKARTILSSSANNISFGSHRFTVTPDSSYYVNGQAVSDLGSLYAIGKDGVTAQIGSGSELYAVTGQGTSKLSGASASSYKIVGKGSGHHIGMSQWGARGMAEKGFSYDQIIKFYFTGVQVGPAA